ncbi:MAG: methionyl-tRNA formyltransferase, partial [Myroides sp.]
MEKLRIVFMGTPDFAVGILDTILKNNYEIAAVITAPDKPAGRGQKLNQSAVKVYAEENNLKVLQPTNLKSEDFLAELSALNANLQIVVAFRMLPKAVWQMPKLGTFNLHASLLPDYRGAAPINWAIINGEEKTGVSTFFIDEKIDTGAVILKNETNISEEETAGELHDRLMLLGAETVVETLKLLENNQVTTTIQPAEETKTAYKLNRENCKIDFNKSSKEVYNLIRGLNPYPSAYTILTDNGNEYNIKIHDVTYTIEQHNFKPGKFIAAKKTIRI